MRTRTATLALTFAFAALLATTAAGADEATQPTTATAESGKEVETAKTEYVTREDLDALKDILDESIKRGVGSRYLIGLSGYAVVGYYGNGDAADSFGVYYAGLNLAGTLREDPVEDFDVRYNLGFLYLGNAVNVTNTGGTTSQVNTPFLSDVWIATDIRTNKQTLEPAWTLTATLGQQYIPFGQDLQATEDQRPTINYTQYVSKWGLGRDIGLKLNGGFINTYDPGSGITTPTIAYQVGGWNGNGSNKRDNNNEKDFTARVIYNFESQYLSTFRNLSIGGSTYIGTVGATGGSKADKQLYAAELSWLRKPFLLTAEAAWGRNPFGATDTKANIHSTGYVATLFWTPSTLPDFQPLFRYDVYDPNTQVGNDRTSIYSIGFNYFIWQTEPVTRRTYTTTKTERVIKLQANWNLTKNEGRPLSANDFNVQVVATF